MMWPAWNMSANCHAGVFDSCNNDTGNLWGCTVPRRFTKTDTLTPTLQPIPSSSQFTTVSTIRGGTVVISSAPTTLTSITSGTLTIGKVMSIARKAASESGNKNRGVVTLGFSSLDVVGSIVGVLFVS
ncbi:uncharacterized protein EV420DRAFT_1500948 [Desarmillaria tabescens]|uniref:Uncharacterized protein n=1 Tax=Armillaria tabescens TaxID=1929756 RepID=A0AA39NS39_ARMTA|nr:uncharacterized protein EV420DRAFT_1500948 [Desarmillaria tabescens]KAK0470483.1 hypothetical protein EV420DRAFT_1500948 [Desarmillaria tabescens]